MTVDLSTVVVPYARFLERRERRGRVALELTRQDDQPTIEAEPVAVARPVPSSIDQPPLEGEPRRVKNPDRTT